MTRQAAAEGQEGTSLPQSQLFLSVTGNDLACQQWISLDNSGPSVMSQPKTINLRGKMRPRTYQLLHYFFFPSFSDLLKITPINLIIYYHFYVSWYFRHSHILILHRKSKKMLILHVTSC